MHENGIPRLPENLAGWDRILRIALAFSLFALGLSGLFAESTAAAIRIASLIPLAMGGFGWCPFYAALGIDTRRRKT